MSKVTTLDKLKVGKAFEYVGQEDGKRRVKVSDDMFHVGFFEPMRCWIDDRNRNTLVREVNN